MAEAPKTPIGIDPGLREGSNQSLLLVKSLVKEFVLSKSGLFNRNKEMFRAVDGVSFDIRRGETFGLVGESGCGKSTTARCILQLLKPTSGEIWFDGIDLNNLNGEEMRQFRQRMQVVFQDPHASLDSRMSILDLVAEPLLVHGIKDPAQRKKRAEDMLMRVGIKPELADRKPFAFSGGQKQRVGIARALILNPEFVVLDEPVSALDVSIQAQVLNLLRTMQQQLDLTYLFIVHDLIVAEYFCDRLAVLYLGSVMEMASREQLFKKPLHPYTVVLLSAVPVPDPAGKGRVKRIILEGEVNANVIKEGGCRFRSRCPVGKDRDICREHEPPLIEMAPDHWVACHFAGELNINDM